MPKPYPFGLVGAGPAYQDAVHHVFIDHAEHDRVDGLYMIDLPKADQPTPVVNMVAIRQIMDESFNTISEESPEPYSEGSTNSCTPFPLGFGGELFTVSHVSVAVDGETSVQRCEREARNANRQRRRHEEAENAAQVARGRPPPLAHNLQH